MQAAPRKRCAGRTPLLNSISDALFPALCLMSELVASLCRLQVICRTLEAARSAHFRHERRCDLRDNADGLRRTGRTSAMKHVWWHNGAKSPLQQSTRTTPHAARCNSPRSIRNTAVYMTLHHLNDAGTERWAAHAYR